MAFFGRETYQMQDGFVPDVFRDPYIRVALPEPPPRVRMPPSPDDDCPTPPGSPISIQSSEGGLEIGSIPPARRLINEFAMPFLNEKNFYTPTTYERLVSRLWPNLDQNHDQNLDQHLDQQFAQYFDQPFVQQFDQYRDARIDQNLEQRPAHEVETAEMFHYLTLGEDPRWKSPPAFQGVSPFPWGPYDNPGTTYEWQQSNQVSPLGPRMIDQFAPLMRWEPSRQRAQHNPWARPSHRRRKKYWPRNRQPRQTGEPSQDTPSRTETKTETEDNAEGREEETEPDWRMPVQRRVRSQSLSAVEDGASARSHELADDESTWESRSVRS